MPRHIMDTPKTYDSAVPLREFLRIARTERPHRATLKLQRRATEHSGLVQFIRIAREQQS